MKKLCLRAALAALVFPLVSAQAFTEGQDYTVLTEPLAAGEGRILKIYSYDCPFCFRFDQGVDPVVMPRIEQNTALRFEPWHLQTKGQYGRTASEFLAWTLLLDRAAGREPSDKASLFARAKYSIYFAFNKRHERWSLGEFAFIGTLCEATGLTDKEFAQARRREDVLALVGHWEQGYRVAKLQGIPAYLVNGKYLINNASLQGLDAFVELVEFLSKK